MNDSHHYDVRFPVRSQNRHVITEKSVDYLDAPWYVDHAHVHSHLSRIQLQIRLEEILAGENCHGPETVIYVLHTQQNHKRLVIFPHKHAYKVIIRNTRRPLLLLYRFLCPRTLPSLLLSISLNLFSPLTIPQAILILALGPITSRLLEPMLSSQSIRSALMPHRAPRRLPHRWNKWREMPIVLEILATFGLESGLSSFYTVYYWRCIAFLGHTCMRIRGLAPLSLHVLQMICLFLLYQFLLIVFKLKVLSLGRQVLILILGLVNHFLRLYQIDVKTVVLAKFIVHY